MTIHQNQPGFTRMPRKLNHVSRDEAYKYIIFGHGNPAFKIFCFKWANFQSKEILFAFWRQFCPSYDHIHAFSHLNFIIYINLHGKYFRFCTTIPNLLNSYSSPPKWIYLFLMQMLIRKPRNKIKLILIPLAVYTRFIRKNNAQKSVKKIYTCVLYCNSVWFIESIMVA